MVPAAGCRRPPSPAWRHARGRRWRPTRSEPIALTQARTLRGRGRVPPPTPREITAGGTRRRLSNAPPRRPWPSTRSCPSSPSPDGADRRGVRPAAVGSGIRCRRARPSHPILAAGLRRSGRGGPLVGRVAPAPSGGPAGRRPAPARRSRRRAGRHPRPGQPAVLARGAPATRERAVLTLLDARLDRSTSPARAYLLGLDISGDGRAVVAIGDPDRAAHVVTYVPGTGSALDRLDATCTLPAADRLAERGRPDRGGGALAGLRRAGQPGRRRLRRVRAAGRAALDRFQDGLRGTHEDGPAHQTVVGHSYGSLVVGYTAREPGLAADDVVFVASPGVGVDRAAGLGMPAGHVWATHGGGRPDPAHGGGRTPSRWWPAGPTHTTCGSAPTQPAALSAQTSYAASPAPH